MRKYGTLVNQSMVVQTGKTITAYSYTTSDPYYESTEASPLVAVEVGHGRYYFDVLETKKYTIVVTTGSTTQTTNINILMEGDDFVQLQPEE